MNKLLESRAAAWTALILVIILIIVTFRMRSVWWSFIDLFFVFMMVFSHLAALYLKRMSPQAGRTLDRVAFVCALLTVVAFVGEYIAFQFIPVV